MTTRLALPPSRRRWATSRYDEYGRHDELCTPERPCARHEVPWGGEYADKRAYNDGLNQHHGGKDDE